MTKYEILKQYFGYSAFRNGQDMLIDAITDGRDAIGIMPTGGGKSLCYQIPAMLKKGITLVVSPLISLMKDQVMALKSVGIPAAFINSSLSVEQLRKVYKNLQNGAYKIVYIAPERLDSEGFGEFAGMLDISLVAVDEAHCISQWGQDFRPSYLKIVDFLHKLKKRPVLAAFTATATQTVREDIEQILKLRNPFRVTTGFDRPNLSFEVVSPKHKQTELISLVSERKGKSGIVYCATRSNVEKICDVLQKNGIAATRYHAGLEIEERRKNQEDFIYDACPVMVATNAFGMGINKSNVGYVIHYNMPMSLESYYQEAGRAGRDGEAADCILMFSMSDIHTATMLIQAPGANEELSEKQREALRMRDMARLNQMIDYCRTTKCLRGFILDYFGQEHEEICGNCGNCRAEFVWKDITTEAKMILSCVKRAYDKLGFSVGKGMIASVLHGSKMQKVMDFGLHELTTYGIMREYPQMYIRQVVDFLEEKGYLRTDLAHGGLLLTENSSGILFGNVKPEMPLKELPKPKGKKDKKQKAVQMGANDALYESLRTLRAELALKGQVPAYIVFSNATLADMAAKAPHSMQELLEVSGVGNVKAERYGKAFLEKIEEFVNKSNIG